MRERARYRSAHVRGCNLPDEARSRRLRRGRAYMRSRLCNDKVHAKSFAHVIRKDVDWIAVISVTLTPSYYKLDKKVCMSCVRG